LRLSLTIDVLTNRLGVLDFGMGPGEKDMIKEKTSNNGQEKKGNLFQTRYSSLLNILSH